jgi:hypothetical protein
MVTPGTAEGSIRVRPRSGSLNVNRPPDTFKAPSEREK